MRYLAALAAALPVVLATPEEYLHGQSELVSRQAPICLTNGGVHIIASSGAGAPMIDGYGLLISTVDSIKAAIPGSTNYSTPYDKTNITAAVPAAVAGGVVLLSQNIADYAASCPNDPIVLIGYSQGAIVTGNTLCGRSHLGSLPYGTPLSSTYADNIIASIFYGDETRIPGQPYDLGTCVAGEGVNPRGNPAGCDAFSDNFQSYCDLNDPMCCVGSPNPNNATHYVYPAEYDGAVTSFVLSKYNLRKSQSSSSSSSSSTSSTSTSAISSSTSSSTSTSTGTSTGTSTSTSATSISSTTPVSTPIQYSYSAPYSAPVITSKMSEGPNSIVYVAKTVYATTTVTVCSY